MKILKKMKNIEKDWVILLYIHMKNGNYLKIFNNLNKCLIKNNNY